MEVSEKEMFQAMLDKAEKAAKEKEEKETTKSDNSDDIKKEDPV